MGRIARLVEPGAGTIQAGGRDVTALSGVDVRRARTGIAMIVQRSCLVRRQARTLLLVLFALVTAVELSSAQIRHAIR